MKNKEIELSSIGFLTLKPFVSAIIIVAFLISIISIVWIANITNQINELPKRVCWNETEYY